MARRLSFLSGGDGCNGKEQTPATSEYMSKICEWDVLRETVAHYKCSQYEIIHANKFIGTSAIVSRQFMHAQLYRVAPKLRVGWMSCCPHKYAKRNNSHPFGNWWFRDMPTQATAEPEVSGTYTMSCLTIMQFHFTLNEEVLQTWCIQYIQGALFAYVVTLVLTISTVQTSLLLRNRIIRNWAWDKNTRRKISPRNGSRNLLLQDKKQLHKNQAFFMRKAYAPAKHLEAIAMGGSICWYKYSRRHRWRRVACECSCHDASMYTTIRTRRQCKRLPVSTFGQ